ncbi:uncharacterized protein LOC144149199 [Haemaphysalis longicornis]
MERHGELVKASFQYKKSTAVVGLSLEMGVMTYLLKHNSGGAHDIAYKPCLNAGPLSDASMVCPYDTPQAKVESSATVAGYVMRTSQAHVFLGDTVKTIEDKVEYVKALRLRNRFSWLLFNVHLTDLSYTCFHEHFERVSKLKALFQKY